MNTVVFVPFAASVLLVALSRILATRLRPRAAAWALSAAMPLVAERAAVIAHEHVHLDEHHALLATVSRLSAALNPLLAPITGDLRFVLERSADEAAAATTSRGALASGIAKAALATVHGARVAGSTFALHRQAVADRIAALLAEPTERTRPAWVLVAVAVVAVAAVAWALHDTERFFEAARLWSRR